MAISNAGGSGTSIRQHVRVYDWNGSAWIQRGTDINEQNNGEDDGDNVSMSDDGNTVAIGYVVDDIANNGSIGRVRIFDWK